MSKAEQMFNKLNYFQYETENDDIAYSNKQSRPSRAIIFNKKTKKVVLVNVIEFLPDFYGPEVALNIELFLAITEQMKELGWL